MSGTTNERALISRNKREGGYCGKSYFSLSAFRMTEKARHFRAGPPAQRQAWSPRSLRDWDRV